LRSVVSCWRIVNDNLPFIPFDFNYVCMGFDIIVCPIRCIVAKVRSCLVWWHVADGVWLGDQLNFRPQLKQNISAYTMEILARLSRFSETRSAQFHVFIFFSLGFTGECFLNLGYFT
jgi:hypothetical protein